MNDYQINIPQLSKHDRLKTCRVLYLDVLRVLATFGVIFLHVGGTDYHLPVMQYDWIIAVVDDSLVRWAVPMFIMISGTLFLNPSKKVSIRELLTKYVKRIFQAYVFWYIAYLIFNTLYKTLARGNFSFHSIDFRPQYHLWFLPMLMGVYLLIPLFKRIVNKEKLLRYALSLWLGYLSISFLFVWTDLMVPQISDLFVMNEFVGYGGYFLLGYYLSCVNLSRKQKRCIYLAGIVGAFITVTGNILMSILHGIDDELFLYNVSPHVMLMSASIFILVKESSFHVSDKITNLLEYVRKDLFGIYLIHGIWLLVFNRSLFRDCCNHIISIPVITLIIFICSLYSAKLLRQVKRMKIVIE